MPGRGATGAPILTNNPDGFDLPWSLSRPVPRMRAYPIQSFGPGALINTNTTDPIHWNAPSLDAWWKDFNRAAGPSEHDERENCSVLNAIRSSDGVIWRDDNVLVPQPTWGFYVFLIDYDPGIRDSVSHAMENGINV